MVIISFAVLLLTSCSTNFPSPGWEDTWMKQQFSDSSGCSEQKSQNLHTEYDGMWVYLTRPMQLVTLRGNYDEDWHLLLEKSTKIPERILSGDSRFYRTYQLPAGTELYVVGAKEFRRTVKGKNIPIANRYVMMVRLWQPDFRRMVPVFYNIGNQQDVDKRIGVSYRCDLADSRGQRDVLLIHYRSIKSLPFVAAGESGK